MSERRRLVWEGSGIVFVEQEKMTWRKAENRESLNASYRIQLLHLGMGRLYPILLQTLYVFLISGCSSVSHSRRQVQVKITMWNFGWVILN